MLADGVPRWLADDMLRALRVDPRGLRRRRVRHRAPQVTGDRPAAPRSSPATTPRRFAKEGRRALARARKPRGCARIRASRPLSSTEASMPVDDDDTANLRRRPLVLRLYDLRREEKLRAAREWFRTEFFPRLLRRRPRGHGHQRARERAATGWSRATGTWPARSSRTASCTRRSSSSRAARPSSSGRSSRRSSSDLRRDQKNPARPREHREGDRDRSGSRRARGGLPGAPGGDAGALPQVGDQGRRRPPAAPRIAQIAVRPSRGAPASSGPSAGT